MHKDFYASGFLYHLPTQQILLQQQKSTVNSTSYWSLFGGAQLHQETAEAAFQRIIHQSLRIKIDLSAIYPVYAYFHKDMAKNHAIVYAKIEDIHNFSLQNGIAVSWFTFKQIQKLPIGEQTKHDLTVGGRVIDSHIRKSLGQQTLE